MGKGLQRGCCQETPTGLEWSSLHVEASGFSTEVLPVSPSPSSYRHLSQSYTAPSLRHPVSLPASLPLQCDRHHGHQGHDPPLVSPYARSAPPKDFTLYLPDLHTSTHAFVIYWALSMCQAVFWAWGDLWRSKTQFLPSGSFQSLPAVTTA